MSVIVLKLYWFHLPKISKTTQFIAKTGCAELAPVFRFTFG